MVGTIDNSPVILNDVMPRFSRYEQKQFLLLVFSYTPFEPFNYSKLKDAQRNLTQFLNGRFPGIHDHFAVTVTIEKYDESVKMQNPIPILSRDEAIKIEIPNGYKKVVGESYTKYYSIRYMHRENEQGKNYVRELNTIYALQEQPVPDGNDTKQRSVFYDRIHTEFMFFIRGGNLENELRETYCRVTFLHSMVEFLEDQWVKIRTLFSILPKFSISKKSISSKVFFYLLEVNAQIYALLTKIKFDVEHKRNYYDQAFERLHFTIEKDGTESEINYYQELNQLAYKSFESYTKKIDILDRSVAQLNDNIQQLRSDFDSNTNVVLQWLMFMLSIVLVLWGGVTLIYDKWVNTFDSAINNPEILVILGVLGTLILILFLYLVIAKFWLNSSSKIINKDINKMIRNWLNDKETDDNNNINTLIDEYKGEIDLEDEYRNRITKSLELCSLILPGVALNRISEQKAIKLVAELDEKFS